jgi:RNA polymerase sigma-70 factor (ECF subfamily)
MTEERAIELCVKHRDPAGFEFLVQKYRREAFMHAYGILGNQEDALDACQDAFARAFVAIPALPELPAFYPWLYSILRNRCLNLLARKEVSDRFREREEGDPAFGIDPNDPASLVQRGEDRESVRIALEGLEAGHREILTLKYILGHPYEQIAGLLDIPRGTVMSRLYHARLAFRKRYLSIDSGRRPERQKNLT